MAEPDPSQLPPARHPWLRALYRGPMFVLATIYFLIDDVVLAAVRPVVAWAAELRLFARMAEALHRLPPYPTLALFLVPFVVLEPFKLWGLWLLATGHFTAGAIMLATSHLTSIVLVERLFHATRDKLLTIGWFARAYGWVCLLYDLTVGRLRQTPAWHAVVAALTRLRLMTRDVVATLRPGMAAMVRAMRPLAETAGGLAVALARRLRRAVGR